MVMMQDPVKSLGQYFTPRSIADFMVQLISFQDPISILEPSAGTGIFVTALEGYYSSITAIELDTRLESNSKTPIMYQNFFDLSIDEQFDVVIGNPPYVRWRNQPKEIRDDIIQRKFWNERLNALADMMQAFIFKSIDHLKPDGELIFLTPKFWLETLHAGKLRQFIIETGFIDLVIDFSETKIFPSVSSNLIIFRYHKTTMKNNQKIKVFTFLDRQENFDRELELILQVLKGHEQPADLLNSSNVKFFESKHPQTNQSWKLISENESAFIESFESSCTIFYKIEKDLPDQPDNIMSDSSLKNQKKYVTVADIFEIGNGMVSGLDKAFWLEKNPIMQKEKRLLTKQELLFIKKVVKARFMDQYTVNQYAQYIFIEEKDFSSEESFKNQCPNLFALLEPFKDGLLKRWSVKPVPWYVWSFPRNQTIFETFQHKFFLPCKERFDNKGFIRCAYDDQTVLGVQDITVLGLLSWVKESPEYILAYLNSEMLFKWLIIKGLKRGGVFQFSEHPLSSVPIRLIDWNNDFEKKIHDQITEKIGSIKVQTDNKKRNLTKKEIEELLEQLFNLKH